MRIPTYLTDPNDSLAASTVLVVDDEACVRDLLTRWLRAAGYLAASAENAAAAWEFLQSHDVQLITCDLRMPGCSGLELLARLRTHFPDTSVVMLTGSGDTAAAIQALTGGACGYLIKPAQRDELLFHVRQGLERRELLLGKRDYLDRLERRVQEQTIDIRHAHEETIYRLMHATMCRDEETGTHVRRTGLLSEVLARAAGWPSSEIAMMRLAAPMHDVGKIGIPDAILRKPGKLTAEEYEIMKRHTVIGARMLAGSHMPVLKMAHDIALHHHERWDGQGYPQALRGDAIPECARILSIIDVYDALTHDRVYRPAFSAGEAAQMLRAGQSTQFEPGLLGLFFTVLDEIEVISQQHPDLPVDDATVEPDAPVALRVAHAGTVG